jgi:CxxC-x17-CxxC domain-containing protein
MTSYEGYQDRILTCRDCGQEFTFTSGEQEFFASKGLTNAPSRCPECRKARRGNSFSSTRPRGEQHEAICASCGKTTTVPFVPREDRPVYCSDCFQEQRSSRSSRGGSYSGSGGYSSGGGGGWGNRNGGGRDRRDRNSGSDWGNRW